MRKLLLSLLFLAGAVPAMAADLPAKAMAAAPVSTPCTAAGCSGFYVGGFVEGMGSNADILGSGINSSIFAGGAGLGLVGGYQLWNGNFFAAAEVGGTYDVGGTSILGTVAGVKPYAFDYVAKFGYGLNGLFNGPPTPSQGPVSVIQTLNAAMISPYAIVGGRTRNFGSGLVTGAGIEYTLGGGWAANAEYRHVNYDITTGPVPVTVGTENLVRAMILKKF